MLTKVVPTSYCIICDHEKNIFAQKILKKLQTKTIDLSNTGLENILWKPKCQKFTWPQCESNFSDVLDEMNRAKKHDNW